MPDRKRKKILLVEDQLATTLYVTQQIERFGYDVISVDTGEIAVTMAAIDPTIDLILMDIMLGAGINGTEAARQILGFRNIPVVYLTSHSDEDTVELVRGLPRYGYILKQSENHIFRSSLEMAFELFEAHDTIRIEEEKHLAMIAGISDVIAIIDRQGKVLYISTNIERCFGWDPASILGTDVFERIHWEDVGRMYNEFEALIDTVNEVKKAELRYKCKDGEYSWVEVSAVNLLHDAAVGGVLVNFRDINDRKTFEQQKQESESKYKALFEQSSDAIFLMNREGLFIDCNRVAGQIFTCSKAEIINHTPIEFSPEFQSDGMRSGVKALLYLDQVFAGHPQAFEWTHRQKGGEEFIAQVNLSPITLNEETFVYAILRDITDVKLAETKRQQLEDQLIRSQRLESIGTLAAGIAHDFNNILASIIGNASMMAEMPGKSEKNQRRIESILFASERGANVVKQLLAFARKADIHHQPINVNDVILEVMKLLEATFPKNIEIRNQLISNLPSIKGDANQLHQVLLNLSVNAKDAMPTGGSLCFGASCVPGESLRSRFPAGRSIDYVAINVKDSGVGMTKEIRARIFDPFFTTKGPGKGTGLGLSVAIGIIEKHGGFIDVISRAGAGTEFEIYFPAIEQNEEVVEQVQEKEMLDLSGSETILLIEDDRYLGEVLFSTLENIGYEVIRATNGEEGVELFHENAGKIDLILSDYGLPKFDGEEVYRRIRQCDTTTPILIMSGFIEPERRDHLLSIGVSAVISKPYQLTDLHRMIREQLQLTGRSERR
jgi:PAS domain S-box-containing protein